MDNSPTSPTRLRREREARTWSQRDVIRNLRAQAANQDPPEELPSEEALVRSLKRWETGEHLPDSHYQRLIARVFGTVSSALFPREPAHASSDLVAATGMDTMELVSRMRTSSVDTATLDAMRITADQLCSEYPFMPSDQLRLEGQQWLQRAKGLLDQRLTLAQHREVLSIAGLIALLVGCVEYDMGQRRQAEATRRSALDLGTESDDRRVMGWAHEMTAWFSLTQGDYQSVIAAGNTGMEVAGNRDVSVQLAAQQAKAWARLGDRRQTELALERGRDLLEPLPYPENRQHHFVVDPGKFDFYAMDCYRRAGEDDLARNYAEETLRAGAGFDGREVSPMRNAEARVTLGVAAAREGDLDGAVSYGTAALEGDRKSLPSLLMTSAELRDEMQTRYPHEQATAEYLEQLHELSTGGQR